MASDKKTFDAVLNGRGTIAFRDLEHLLLALGFKHARTSGSHRIYVHPRVQRPLSIQPIGKDAKRYQIRQLRDMIYEFGLTARKLAMQQHYAINVFWSEEDGVWVADVPDLKSCSAFGDTPDQALAEVQIAMEAWLDVARENGLAIPEPRYRPATGRSRIALTFRRRVARRIINEVKGVNRVV